MSEKYETIKVKINGLAVRGITCINYKDGIRHEETGISVNDKRLKLKINYNVYLSKDVTITFKTQKIANAFCDYLNERL